MGEGQEIGQFGFEECHGIRRHGAGQGDPYPVLAVRGGESQDLVERARQCGGPVGQGRGDALEAGCAAGADIEQDGGFGGVRLGEGEGKRTAAVDEAGAFAVGADLLGTMEMTESDVVQTAGLLGQGRASQAGVDASGNGVDAADANIPFGLGSGLPADDEGVGHD